MAPLFVEADAPLLKTWLMTRLESSSEADPDVLSDYILALLRHDKTPDEVMSTCISQLSDFMTGNPAVFVKEVFEVLATKSYLTREGRKRSLDTPLQQTPNKFQRQSYVQSQQSYIAPLIPHHSVYAATPTSRYAPWPGQGPPPPGWNSTAPIPMHVPVPTYTHPRPKVLRIKGTCYDFLEKGVCLRGASCPYDHGIAPAVISPSGDLEGPDPYDPLRPNPTPVLPLVSQQQPTQQRLSRYEIHKGPNHTDKTNTTLVVESIPPDKTAEITVREWFEQFGQLNKVIIDHQLCKAILVYATHEAASKAWNDPRPVFNNRFVKIWWKKPITTPEPSQPVAPSDAQSGSNGIRMGENAEKELQAAREAAAKAQKEHEEKQARKAELEKKKEELERQRIELLERQKVEREKLVEKIRRAKEKQDRLQKATSEEQNGAEKTRGENFSVKDVNGSEGGDRKAQLEKMLKDLQYQANALNIPPSEYALNTSLSDTRTQPAFRGGPPYRARGSFRARGRGGRPTLSRSLDLRAKAVIVQGILGTESETSIREWVIMNCADAVCEASEDGKGLVVKFKERYEAEEFLGRLRVPPLGPLSGTWYGTSVATNGVRSGVRSEENVRQDGDIAEEHKEGYYEEEEGEIDASERRWKR